MLNPLTVSQKKTMKEDYIKFLEEENTQLIAACKDILFFLKTQDKTPTLNRRGKMKKIGPCRHCGGKRVLIAKYADLLIYACKKCKVEFGKVLR